MVRSASAASSGVSLGLGVLLLAGCATTQQEATRLQLNSARLRAAELRRARDATGPDDPRSTASRC